MNELYYPKLIITRYLAIFSIGFFCLARPIFSLEYVAFFSIFGIRLNELFNFSISYLFLIVILLGIKDFRFKPFEIILILLILFSFTSILWGSNWREVVKLNFPFLLYFVTKSCMVERKVTLSYIKILIFAFMLPMIVNSILIILNYRVWGTNYWSGIVRFQGLYAGPHSLGHESLIFFYILILYYFLKQKEQNEIGTFCKVAFLILVMIAIYNIYKSYTRTVYLGLISIVFFHFVGQKRYFYLLLLSLILLYFAIQSEQFHRIFFDVIDPLEGKKELESMGSGRIGLWKNSLEIYLKSPERYLIGRGLGNELIVGRSYFGASHSDLVSLLCSLGIIGLILYLAFLLCLISEIYKSKIEYYFKMFFIGYITAVFVTNITSNSYLVRFQLGQYFSFLIGVIMAYCNMSVVKNNENV